MMTVHDNHPVARTDPHSHHELPPERHALYTPRLIVTDGGNNLTETGALVYAANEYRRRLLEDRDMLAANDYEVAIQRLGSHAFHHWIVRAGWLP